MKSLIRENGVEALLGLLVVLLAAWFVSFAWSRTGGGGPAGAMQVSALFPNAAGVNVGTDVRVAGLKVGAVSAQKLDPASYQVQVTLAIEPTLKLPKDSTAAITSEGLLGSTFIALVPGGDPTPLKNGDTIVDTQGAVDLMSMIGQFINKSSSDTPVAGASTSETPAAAK